MDSEEGQERGRKIHELLRGPEERQRKTEELGHEGLAHPR